MTDFHSNWPSAAGGDASTPKQRESRKLNWAKFMVDGMEAQLKYLMAEGAIDAYARNQALIALEHLRDSITFQEVNLEIESEYRRKRGL